MSQIIENYDEILPFAVAREPFKFNSVNFYIAQCVKKDSGYTILANFCKGFAMWCLVVASKDLNHIQDAFDFRAVLMEVV